MYAVRRPNKHLSFGFHNIVYYANNRSRTYYRCTPLRTRATLCIGSRYAGFLYTRRRSLESPRSWRQTRRLFFFFFFQKTFYDITILYSSCCRYNPTSFVAGDVFRFQRYLSFTAGKSVSVYTYTRKNPTDRDIGNGVRFNISKFSGYF